MVIERRGSKVGHIYQLLGHALGGDIAVEPYLIKLEKEAAPYTAFQHAGREFIYMLTGIVDYRHGDKVYRLEPGDSPPVRFERHAWAGGADRTANDLSLDHHLPARPALIRLCGCGAALLRRRVAVALLEMPREMAGALEAARKPHFRHWHGRLPQQRARPLEPYIAIMFVERRVQMAREEPFELAHRNAGRRRQSLPSERAFYMALDQLQRRQQMRVRRLVALLQRAPLRARAETNFGLHEPFADLVGQNTSLLCGDHGVHHVERGDAPGAGQPVAVDHIQRTPQRELWKAFPEGRHMLPMDRAAIAVEKPRARENERPARDAADAHAPPRQAAQPLQRRLRRRIPPDCRRRRR